LDAGDMAAFTTAVNTLGRWLIERKREETVKEITADFDPTIATICDALQKDIGSGHAPGQPGLRSQMWNNYTQQMIALDSYISSRVRVLGPTETRTLVRELASLVRDQQQADATLAAASSSLAKLAEAHAKLAQAFTEDPRELKELIRELIGEGERVKQFYDGLRKGS
jgi:hypothetical protein